MPVFLCPSSGSVRTCEILLGNPLEELDQNRAVFRKHSNELDAVSELRIAGNDSGSDEKSARNIKSEIEARADWKGIHALDVTSAEA